MIRKTFVKKQRLSGEMTLQITSMADAFMIILVFLLKSYGSGTIDVTPSKGLAVPTATPGAAPSDGLKVEIAEDAVRVDSKTVASLQGFSFKSGDVDPTGASRELTAALGKQKTAQPGSRVIVVADRRAPYAMIKTVLASAAVSGYTDFKLAVVNPN